MGRFPLTLLIGFASISAPALPVLGVQAMAQQSPAPAPAPLPSPQPRDCGRKPPQIS